MQTAKEKCEYPLKVGFEVPTAVVMNGSVFYSVTPCGPSRKNMSPPSSSLAYSSTLKMKAACSSETSVDFQQTTRRYIPEEKLFIP
jgi:hypothetical protein